MARQVRSFRAHRNQDKQRYRTLSPSNRQANLTSPVLAIDLREASIGVHRCLWVSVAVVTQRVTQPLDGETVPTTDSLLTLAVNNLSATELRLLDGRPERNPTSGRLRSVHVEFLEWRRYRSRWSRYRWRLFGASGFTPLSRNYILFHRPFECRDDRI